MPRLKTSIGSISRNHNSTGSRRTPEPTGARLKRSRTHVEMRYRGAKISRTRLQKLSDELDNTRNAMNDTAQVLDHI